LALIAWGTSDLTLTSSAKNLSPISAKAVYRRCTVHCFVGSIAEKGDSATLRLLFAKIWVSECYGDVSTTTKEARNTGAFPEGPNAKLRRRNARLRTGFSLTPALSRRRIRVNRLSEERFASERNTP
jgi:hypothetical protein